MRPRPTPLKVPDRPHYFSSPTSNGVADGALWLRLPSLTRARRLAVVTGEAVSAEDGSPDRRIHAMCAALGWCWAHPNYQLDTPRPPVSALENLDELLAYGDEIEEELWEAGLGRDDLAKAYSAFATKLSDVHIGEQEVQERSDFSEARA